MSLISIKNLNVGYPSRKGQFINILKDVNLKIHRGESIRVSLVKVGRESTLALAALGYFKRGLKISSGSVKFDAVDMLTISDNELQSIRGGRIALILKILVNH